MSVSRFGSSRTFDRQRRQWVTLRCRISGPRDLFNQ